MPQLVVEQEVQAPPDRVWNLMCDAARFPEWVEFTDRIVQPPAGPMAQGATWREYGGVAPFKSETQWRMTEFVPPQRQVQVGEDQQMRLTLTLTLEPTASGTRVRAHMQMQPKRVMVLLAPLLWPLFMRSRTKKAMVATFANARRIVEA